MKNIAMLRTLLWLVGAAMLGYGLSGLVSASWVTTTIWLVVGAALIIIGSVIGRSTNTPRRR